MTNTTFQKPIQKTSWSEKNSKKQEFFKKNIDYFISSSSFGISRYSSRRTENIQELYDVYNSNFPSKWFTHVLDPFSAEDRKHTLWPAKMRPANILSPNINLLYGEYPSRPFKFLITVKGDDGYNAFDEARKQELYKNLSQLFINTVNEQTGGGEPTPEEPEANPSMNTGVESKPVEMPEKVMSMLENSYRDIIAIQAQTDIDLIIEDQHIKEKLTDMFKDWLIAGECYSYKDVIRDKTIYERVPVLEIDYDKSPNVKYIEDADWVVRRMYLTVSDVVDRFYDSLKSSDIDELESGVYSSSPQYFADYLNKEYVDNTDKVPVYHVVWKSLMKIKEITYLDPTTGEPQTAIEDENYKVDVEAGETSKDYWVTQVLEGYRIGDKIYVEMKPVNYQPNQLHNLSSHKLPYNGKRFSDTHSRNTSVLKAGLPFQIMYCIIFFTLEKTIAKSRGKVMLLDSNVIPRQEGWNEEKFFWYSEAQGYMLINRNQIGVDKSMNQYQVLDLGMFDHIAKLIELLEFCKTQYDSQLGITPQRKGNVKSTDTATGTTASLNQSSVITEMIFTGFDQLVRADLEGLLNCSQIANINGKKASYTGSDMRTQILNINPDTYCYADMGLMMSDSAQEREQLSRIRTYAQSFAQNGQSPTTILAVETSNNISQLRGILKEVEAKQMEMSKQSAQSEHEKAIEQIQIQQQFQEYLSLLETQKMHEEYDRKSDLVITQGDINMAIEASRSGEEGGQADMLNYNAQREATQTDARLREKEIDAKLQEHKNKNMVEQKKLALKQKEIDIKKAMARAKKTN